MNPPIPSSSPRAQASHRLVAVIVPRPARSKRPISRAVARPHR